MSEIKLVPGKTNLKELGYSMVGDFTSNDLASAWEDADDTSAWILRPEDKKIVGNIDWSFSRSDCNLDSNDIYLDRIDVHDQGKGYGRAAMKQKHNDWKSEGYDSVTLLPLEHPGKLIPPEEQKRLTNWYKSQGYQKSTKCKQHSDSDSSFTCYLTKGLI